MLAFQTDFENQLLIKSKQTYVFKKKENNSKENNMKIEYANECIQNLGMSHPTTCVHQFIYDENNNDEMKTMQYFLMHGLVLFIKVYSYVDHMFYVQSFSNNTEVTIDIKRNKYFTY